MATEQEIYLQKRNSVLIENKRQENPDRDSICRAATFSKNLETLGFIPDGELTARLVRLSRDDLAAVYDEIVPILKQMVGAHRKFQPMYANFPKQVMEMEDAEFYFNAVLHYFGDAVSEIFGIQCRIMPQHEKEDRPILPEGEGSLKPIKLGSRREFNSILSQLLASNGSLSASDKAIVDFFVESRKDSISDLLPDAIPQKENLSYLIGKMSENKVDISALTRLLKTATDVLRVAVVMSGGDVSLATPSKFRKWRRAERRFFLDALENCKETTEDMLRYQEVWKRLGHGLHPFENKEKYPKTCQSFRYVFGKEKFSSFNSKVENGLAFGKIDEVAKLLKARPGEFVRRLDHVLCLAGDDHILDVWGALRNSASKASTPVLLQAYNHFKNRGNDQPRAFFPKGSVTKMKLAEGTIRGLSPDRANQAAEMLRGFLKGRFAQMPSLGKVYIDPAMKEQIVPFAQRSANKSLRTIARGSKLDLPDTPTLRFFAWWKDIDRQRVDVDLSLAFFGEHWFTAGGVYYGNRRHGEICHHSGDITSAPKGACEFIDLQYEGLAKENIRYVAMTLNSYTQQPFSEMPECFAGWMGRKKPDSGEVFEAKTVQDKIDITTETTVNVPVIIDIADKKLIWVDLGFKSDAAINNIGTHRSSLENICRVMTNLNRPNLYDLFSMHAEERGEIVENKEEADTVFSMHEGITPFDIEKILGEFLANPE